MPPCAGLTTPVPPATAWTVVSGYGDDEGTAQAYPVVIEETYGRKVDLVIGGGPLLPEPSTIAMMIGAAGSIALWKMRRSKKGGASAST